MTDDQDPLETIELDAKISAPEERERLLAATLAHAEVQDAQYRQPLEEAYAEPPWRGALALLLLVVAAWVVLAPPTWLVGEPPPPVTAQDRMRGVRAVLFLQAREIDTYRFAEGTLPDSLSQLPFHVDEIRYVRTNNRSFQLVAPGPDGVPVVYDSAVPDEAFAAVATWDESG